MILENNHGTLSKKAAKIPTLVQNYKGIGMGISLSLSLSLVFQDTSSWHMAKIHDRRCVCEVTIKDTEVETST